ncbi:RNA polymerase II elongation factor ELL isoform X1 [Chiloscyllium plagiosum]|uniref:RNA polymerase II elongation factor ELL isoform X1 n=1 Tax=Chiloscyllium plagiosum TaxID=36176 RepID=UPI001CB87248|nr:RNA polymerase II elongation factor ELL isoform X1 [Chiloscyllium plagiosum]
MAALGEERRFGLSCEKLNPGARLSLFHVKLTDSAVRALEAYRRLAASLPNQPVICFQGNQGQYIKIPAPKSDYHDGVRCFSFYLSTDSKDKPQASFDCIHQYVSSFKKDHLDCLGSIQDKITVCATDDSYQMTRERVSQVEKESWSRTTIEIKPGSSCQGVRKPVHFRKQTSSPAGDGIPLRKHSPTMNSGFGVKKTYASTVTQRPLKDRVIHLLALKPYKKPELLLWLEKEKANPKDKAELSSVLEQVAKVNVKDNNSYTLKDELYKEIQQDWPGYSDEEKQLIRRQLIRKRQPSHSSQTKSSQLSSPFQKSSGESSPQSSPVKNSLLKRPVPLEQIDLHTNKRSKVLQSKDHPQLVLNGQHPHSTCLTATTNSCVTVKTEFQQTRTSLSGCPNEFNEPFKECNNSSSDVNRSDKDFKRNRDITGNPRSQVTQASLEQTAYPLRESAELSSSHNKKKSKKHKEKVRQHAKPEIRTWRKESPAHQVGNLRETIEEHETTNTSATASSTVEMPDYLLKYTAISSLELYQNYRNDFNAEYSEYRDLHARVGNVTEQFMQLGSKIKALNPGTEEYKMVEDQIFEEYKKFKKTHPAYREEKVRCEYLHRKLSHIKQLILEFDSNQMSS